MDSEDAHPFYRIVAEDGLLEEVFAACLVVVLATIDQSSVVGIDGKMVIQMNVVVGEHRLQLLIQTVEVDAVFQRTVA